MYLTLAFSEGRPGDWGGGSEGVKRSRPSGLKRIKKKKHNKTDKGGPGMERKEMPFFDRVISDDGHRLHMFYLFVHRYGDTYLLSEGHTYGIYSHK